MRALAYCAIVAGGLMAGESAQAGIITFLTPNDAVSTAGNPVAAQADFEFAGSTLTVTVSNLTTETTAASELIRLLDFRIAGATTGSLTSSVGVMRTVAADGSYMDAPLGPTAWSLTLSSDGMFELHVPSPPTQTLIGPPSVGSGLYDRANASVTKAHSPELAGPVTFTITGIDGSSVIDPGSVVFGFGTGTQTVPTVPVGGNIPEPATLGLLAGGMGLMLRRRRI